MWSFALGAILVLTLVVLLRLQRKGAVAPVLSLSLLLCFGLWYLVPAILTRLFWGTNTDYGFQLKTLGLDYDAYVRVAFIEVAAFCLAVAVLLKIPRPSFRFVTESRLARQKFDPRLILAVLILGFLMVLYIVFSTEALWGTDYLERNSFLMTADAETLGLSSIISLLTEVGTCFAYACLITPLPKSPSTRVVTWLSWGWVLYSVASSVFTGQRIMLLAPIVVYIMRHRALELWTWRHTAKIVAVAFATMMIGAPVALVIRDIRGGGAISSDYVQSEAAARPNNGIQDEILDSVQEMVIKFNSPLCGELLLETGNGYGWQPFVGSALALVPRIILPDKPVPGSMTTDYWGHPTRIVAVLQGMEESGNVQVSPAAIAIWELGYTGGLVLLIAFNVLLLYLLNSLLLSGSILCNTLALYVIQIPVFYTLFPSPDTVVQLVQRVGIVLLLGAIIQRMFSSRTEPGLARPVAAQPGAL